jgi:hypothetical protein
MENYFIRKISQSDLLQISNIHLVSFPESALTKLVLGSVVWYYQWLSDGLHPRKFHICIEHVDIEIAGFC